MKPSATDKLYSVAGIAAIADSLATEGIATSEALAGAHLLPAQLNAAETRVSLNQIVRCYRNASRLSRDPNFAYHTGLRFHLSTYGMYGFAILSSTDFWQTVRFAVQYQQLVLPDAEITFTESRDSGAWTIRPASLPFDGTTYRFVVELHFGIAVSLHREVMGPLFRPRELTVTYGPPTTQEPLEDTFGCPVLFNCPKNTVVVDRKWLDGPATLGNELAYLEVLKLCDRLLKEMQLRVGVAGSVREALLINLGQPMSLSAVSRRLKVPPRTLKRKLKEEGTSYRAIIDELRMELASRYLRDTALAIEDIASSLRFSDAASFRRAFRRWTKKTPSAFRRTTESTRA